MRGLVLVVGTAVALLAGVGVVSAHDTRYRTSSSFGFGVEEPVAALGFINQFSGNRDCGAGRRVKLYRERGGRDLQIGSDRSGVPAGSGDGYWEIEHNLRSGRYYIRIKKKNIGSGSHDHICRAYRSSTLRYPGGTPARPR